MTQLIKHPKRRGEWAELQFAARAASFGRLQTLGRQKKGHSRSRALIAPIHRSYAELRL